LNIQYVSILRLYSIQDISLYDFSIILVLFWKNGIFIYKDRTNLMKIWKYVNIFLACHLFWVNCWGQSGRSIMRSALS